MAQTDDYGQGWRRACRLALINAAVFFAWTFAAFHFELETNLNLAAPAIFACAGGWSFVLMLRSGGAFAPVAWFVLGAAVYFGMGALAGALLPGLDAPHVATGAMLSQDLVRTNLLNSTAVLVVLAIAIPLTLGSHTSGTRLHASPETFRAIFPLALALALVAVILRYVFFLDSDDFVLRSMLAPLYMVIPFFLFMLGMLWPRLSIDLRVLGSAVFVLEMGYGLVALSKFAMLYSIVGLVAGTWIRRHTIRYILASMALVAVGLIIAQPLITSGRLHPQYNAIDDTVLNRLSIVADVATGSTQVRKTDDSETQDAFMRVSVLSVQAFLMKQYDSGRPGNSIEDFWTALIPRVVWPDKPVITRFGGQLYSLYFNNEPGSALAPSFNGEAYWNYGWIGVIVVSLVIGLEIGWLTRRWMIAAAGNDPAFLVISVPTAMWAMLVEAWVTASYVGGFITFVVLWMAGRIFFRVRRRGRTIDTAAAYDLRRSRALRKIARNTAERKITARRPVI